VSGEVSLYPWEKRPFYLFSMTLGEPQNLPHVMEKFLASAGIELLVIDPVTLVTIMDFFVPAFSSV
jgi:hypothetical protein